jgi:hypothetical protein
MAGSVGEVQDTQQPSCKSESNQLIELFLILRYVLSFCLVSSS